MQTLLVTGGLGFIGSNFILQAREKRLPIYGDGQNIRDWLYVTDRCEALYLVLQHSRVGETYNIGGKNEEPISPWLRKFVLFLMT